MWAEMLKVCASLRQVKLNPLNLPDDSSSNLRIKLDTQLLCLTFLDMRKITRTFHSQRLTENMKTATGLPRIGNMIDDLKKLTKRLKQARNAARTLLEVPKYDTIYLGDERAAKLGRMIDEIAIIVKPLRPVVADEHFFKASGAIKKKKRG